MPKPAPSSQSVAKMVDPTPSVGDIAPISPPDPPAKRPTHAGRRTVAAGAKVRAHRAGYYQDARRRVGDVFRLADAKDFTETWMEPVDPATPERTTTGQQEVTRANQAELAARRAAPSHPPPAAPVAPATGEFDPLGDPDEQS